MHRLGCALFSFLPWIRALQWPQFTQITSFPAVSPNTVTVCGPAGYEFWGSQSCPQLPQWTPAVSSAGGICWASPCPTLWNPQLTHLFSFFRESAVISAWLLLMTLSRGPYIFSFIYDHFREASGRGRDQCVSSTAIFNQKFSCIFKQLNLPGNII